MHLLSVLCLILALQVSVYDCLCSSKIQLLAGSSDVEVKTTRLIINPPTSLPVQTFSAAIIFRQDGIALENNETFTLTLTSIPLTRFGANPTIQDTMTGTVVDSTGKDIMY